MKKILHRATAFSLAICMTVTLLFAGGTHTASAEATDFDVMLGRLEKLEDLAKEYHKNYPFRDDVNQLVLSYIRSARYSSKIWNLTAGEADDRFINYVAEKSPDTANLRDMYLLTLPNGDITDFPHLFAVINMNTRNIKYLLDLFKLGDLGDLGGWMGDTCELAEDIQNEASGLDALTDAAKKHFRVDGSFNEQDWVADLDGYNLYKMKSGSETWAACLERYFAPTLTEKQRVAKFIRSNLGSIYTSATVTRDKYRDIVADRYNTDGIAMLWKSRNDTDFNSELDYHNAACNAVADYLFDTVCAPKPSETSVCIDFANETLEIAAGIKVNSAKNFKGTGYVSGDTIAPGTTLYAQGVRDVEAGSFIPSEVVTFTAPRRGNAPEVPQLTEATVNSLSFSSVEGVEYSIDDGETWQSGTTFTGLTPHTAYSVICRYRATETAFASESSEACEVSTPLPEDVYVDERGIYLADDGKIRCMMAAAYRDGRMVSVHAAEKDDNGVWNCPVPDNAKIDSVRIFVLGENFLPLIETYQVVLNPL